MRALALILLCAAAHAESDHARSSATRELGLNLPIVSSSAARHTLSTSLEPGGLQLGVESAVGKRLRISAATTPGAMLDFPHASIGARLQLTRGRVATFVGGGWSASGHEGRPEVMLSLSAETRLQRLVLYGRVTWASELDQAQRDADVALAAFHPVGRRVHVGLSGHATIDLDDGRDDGGEVRWEASGGPAASVLLGGAALLLQTGASSRATPEGARSGVFALVSLGGWL